MSTYGCSTNRGRALLPGFISAAFLWALALSVSPHLHEHLHPDAAGPEHSCAVTMMTSGSYDHATHPPLLILPAPTPYFSKTPALTPHWVESPFLAACIFEHAPPACS
jgi:hypothetical protein